MISKDKSETMRLFLHFYSPKNHLPLFFCNLHGLYNLKKLNLCVSDFMVQNMKWILSFGSKPSFVLLQIFIDKHYYEYNKTLMIEILAAVATAQ